RGSVFTFRDENRPTVGRFLLQRASRSHTRPDSRDIILPLPLGKGLVQEQLNREMRLHARPPAKGKLLPLTGYGEDHLALAIASSKISSATSTLSRERISGGDQRIEFAPQPNRIRPRWKLAISTRSRNSASGFFDARSLTNSTPSIMPIPRTSPM